MGPRARPGARRQPDRRQLVGDAARDDEGHAGFAPGLVWHRDDGRVVPGAEDDAGALLEELRRNASVVHAED